MLTNTQLPVECQNLRKGKKETCIGEPMCKALMCVCYLVSIHIYINMKKKHERTKEKKKVKVTEW